MWVRYLSLLFVICFFILSPTLCDEGSNPLQNYKNSSITSEFSLVPIKTIGDVEPFVNITNNIVAYRYLDGSSNDGVLKIKYTPAKWNQTDREAICWAPSTTMEIDDNYTNKKINNAWNVTTPIEIVLAMKGERGNELINLDIFADDNKITKRPLSLSMNWSYYTTYIYPSKSIKQICLEFNYYNNPIGATIYLRQINISYKKNIDMLQTTTNKFVLAPKKEEEFCCTCPDWSNLDAWLKKSKLYCNDTASSPRH